MVRGPILRNDNLRNSNFKAAKISEGTVANSNCDELVASGIFIKSEGGFRDLEICHKKL